MFIWFIHQLIWYIRLNIFLNFEYFIGHFALAILNTVIFLCLLIWDNIFSLILACFEFIIILRILDIVLIVEICQKLLTLINLSTLSADILIQFILFVICIAHEWDLGSLITHQVEFSIKKLIIYVSNANLIVWDESWP